jgi:phosphate uptake regulator
VRQATWLLHVGRFLERMADHAVNVAERVYYLETGELKRSTQIAYTPATAQGQVSPQRPTPRRERV